MRRWWALALGLFAARPGAALEKTAAPGPADPRSFASASTVTLSYYNVCNGWIWSWSGFPPLATYGVRFDDASPRPDAVIRTHLFYTRGAPAGYGYTNVALLLPPFDPRCPGVMPVVRFFTPMDGWNTIVWDEPAGVPVEDFWVLVSHPPTPGNPVAVATEKGEGGRRKGGCGTCFPPSRPPHSFQFGHDPTIICPGIPWFDSSPCDLELLWASEVRIGGAVSIESSSWGRVKSLYR